MRLKLLIVAICLLFLTGCPHHPPPSLHDLSPTGDPLTDVILGSILIGGFIAAEIIDEKLEERRYDEYQHDECREYRDCDPGFTCNNGACIPY